MGLTGFGGSTDAIFGNGADGDLFLTGSIVLQRDTSYRNVILSSSGGSSPIIFTNSWRLRISATCSFLTNGTIDCSGPSGTFAIPGVPISAQTLAPGAAGGSGTVTLGVVGVSQGGTYGGAGGIGGSGTLAGGIGGAAPAPDPISGTVRNLFPILMGYTFGQGGPYPIFGGAGGGGGGGPGAIQRGGGGGAGGGVLCVSARDIRVATSFTGTFQANGGAGGPGEAGSVTGGGGGGGGGVVLLAAAKIPYRFNNFQTDVTGSRFFSASFPNPPSTTPIWPFPTTTGTYVQLFDINFDGLLFLQADGGLGGSASGGGSPGTPGLSGSTFFLEV